MGQGAEHPLQNIHPSGTPLLESPKIYAKKNSKKVQNLQSFHCFLFFNYKQHFFLLEKIESTIFSICLHNSMFIYRENHLDFRRLPNHVPTSCALRDTLLSENKNKKKKKILL